MKIYVLVKIIEVIFIDMFVKIRLGLSCSKSNRRYIKNLILNMINGKDFLRIEDLEIKIIVMKNLVIEYLVMGLIVSIN